jgi:predicted RNase H-like HicB family nuclease
LILFYDTIPLGWHPQINLKLDFFKDRALVAKKYGSFSENLDTVLPDRREVTNNGSKEGEPSRWPHIQRKHLSTFWIRLESLRRKQMKKNKGGKSKKVEVLEYQVNIAFDPRDSIYVARVPELENCHTHGTSPEEALKNAKEAIELWIETAEKRRQPIPAPTSRKKFSGKFVLRTSPELHAALAKKALQSGKSMNELAEEILDSGLKKTG